MFFGFSKVRRYFVNLSLFNLGKRKLWDRKEIFLPSWIFFRKILVKKFVFREIGFVIFFFKFEKASFHLPSVNKSWFFLIQKEFFKNKFVGILKRNKSKDRPETEKPFQVLCLFLVRSNYFFSKFFSIEKQRKFFI